MKLSKDFFLPVKNFNSWPQNAAPVVVPPPVPVAPAQP